MSVSRVKEVSISENSGSLLLRQLSMQVTSGNEYSSRLLVFGHLLVQALQNIVSNAP